MAGDRVDGRALIEVMTTRRSTREGFTREPIAEADLRAILAAGLAAPSSKNAQPWRFHVVRSPDALAAVADAAVHEDARNAEDFVPLDPTTGRPHTRWSSTVVESADVLRHAPVGIFIENRGEFSHDRASVAAADDVTAAVLTYSLELLGVGAAIENLLLAAGALGLGAVFIGDILVAEPVIREQLGLDGDLVGVVAIGHGATPTAPRPVHGDRVVWHS